MPHMEGLLQEHAGLFSGIRDKCFNPNNTPYRINIYMYTWAFWRMSKGAVGDLQPTVNLLYTYTYTVHVCLLLSSLPHAHALADNWVNIDINIVFIEDLLRAYLLHFDL